jgi:hypothetical protein
MKFRCFSFVAVLLSSSCAEAVHNVEDEATNIIERNAGASLDESVGSIRRPQDKRGSHMRMLKTTKNKQTKSSKKDNHEGQECGVDYCENKPISLYGMKTCLKDNFNHLENLYFPEDGDVYHESRQTAYAISRFPAAVVDVENVDEVQLALACAVNNGYRVSVRGGNHSYQGMGTMDGYVVIDMGRTCKPDEFEIKEDAHNQGPHILEGSKYIGTIKAQAGCTNAIMLAAGHKHFKDKGGMTLAGSCPSVGITGFVLGGGGGDASPYIGYAVDMVKEFQIVLYDGTVVEKASEEENADLYWASLGGGGGNGIITHLTYKIVQAPKQKYEEVQGKKFTVLQMTMIHQNLEKGAARLQEWFYDADPRITGKFGGYFFWFSYEKQPGALFSFVYLGSWREAIEDLISTGLLDHDLFQFIPNTITRTNGALLSENYEVKCPSSEIGTCREMDDVPGATGEDYPTYPFFAHQFNSYAEAVAFNMCIGPMFEEKSFFSWTRATGDFCKDLNIDNSHCEELFESNGIPYQVPKSCTDKVVIEAILTVSDDPFSFINSHGPSIEVLNLAFPSLTHPTLNDKIEAWGSLQLPSSSGASMFPRFDDSFFTKLLNETSAASSHLQHGAALLKRPDETAYPWRNAALMVKYGSMEQATDFIGRMLKGGYKPQGYYNYLSPPGMKNWRSYFFGDNWQRLAEIRSKYDPKDVFGKPLVVESLGEQ